MHHFARILTILFLALLGVFAQQQYDEQYPYLDLVPEVYKRSLYGVDDGFTFKGFRGLRGKRMPYMNLKGLRGKRTL
uniref:Secreted protein n=1 Tax=Haemonchus contortus TaxID=6289 RepID=A0A7I5ECB9_HAECO